MTSSIMLSRRELVRAVFLTRFLRKSLKTKQDILEKKGCQNAALSILLGNFIVQILTAQTY
jgi:hypothetical protein